jgi:hypothetical protein
MHKNRKWETIYLPYEGTLKQRNKNNNRKRERVKTKDFK